MFIYLDESGDTGFRFDSGSSRYFVVALLLCPDPIPLNGAIEDLRVELGYDARYEFKFQKSSEAIRTRFLGILVRHELLIRCLVVDKQLLAWSHTNKSETFYQYLLGLILTHDDLRLADATLIIDQREKDKRSKQSMTTYLRKAANESPAGKRRIKSIRYHDSHRDNLLQAVDMVAGAVFTQYRDGNASYVGIIRSKIDDLWELNPSRTQ